MIDYIDKFGEPCYPGSGHGIGLTKLELTSIEFGRAMLTNPALMEAVTASDIIEGNAAKKIATVAIRYAKEILRQLDQE